MYNELRPTLMASAREALRKTREKCPMLLSKASGISAKKTTQRLFEKMKAADYVEEDKAEEQEANFNPRPWSDSMGDPRKQYGDVREQMQSRLQRTEFTLAQHKAFFDQMRRGESCMSKLSPNHDPSIKLPGTDTGGC